MLKSMTGFGRCENATDEYRISVEMKAVNHRYLDLSIKMPKKFNYFEASVLCLRSTFSGVRWIFLSIMRIIPRETSV